MIVNENFTLADILWYKIGGKARYVLQCENREDIVEALDFIKKKEIANVFVCGTGSNLVFSDGFFDGAVMQIISRPSATNQDIHLTQEGFIEAFSGVLLDDVIVYAFSKNLRGLEWAGGLPGTVGAGVRGNVGAYGGEIKDILVSAQVLDFGTTTPQLRTLTNEELKFVYRGSLVKTQKHLIVTSAQFRLEQCNDEQLDEAKKTYALHKEQRRNNHPLEYPNCGSVFKNLRDPEQIKKVLEVYPELAETVEKKWFGKVAVASLIERLGLKGYRVGDAQVSEKHALFIVNRGHATAAEVRSVIDKIQETFQKTFGFTLEVEVEIVK